MTKSNGRFWPHCLAAFARVVGRATGTARRSVSENGPRHPSLHAIADGQGQILANTRSQLIGSTTDETVYELLRRRWFVDPCPTWAGNLLISSPWGTLRRLWERVEGTQTASPKTLEYFRPPPTLSMAEWRLRTGGPTSSRRKLSRIRRGHAELIDSAWLARPLSPAISSHKARDRSLLEHAI